MYLVATSARTRVAPAQQSFASSKAHRESYETAHQTTRANDARDDVSELGSLVVHRFAQVTAWLISRRLTLADARSGASTEPRSRACGAPRFAARRCSRKALGLVIKRVPGLLLCVVSALTVGCTASHKSITAMRTPCKLHDIEISDEVFEAERETWTASCQGKRYACSTTGFERRVVYACKLLEESTAPEDVANTASKTRPANGTASSRRTSSEAAGATGSASENGTADGTANATHDSSDAGVAGNVASDD